jgi:DNA-binding GntR family transcriptional regulator
MSQREEVYQKIREAVTFGILRPGERIVETKICETFKVGRTPLREALRQLQMEGFVDVLPNKGAIISTVSIRDVDEIYSIVGLLEGYATEMATKLMGPTDKRELKAIQNDLKKAGIKKDYRKWLEKNTLFHGYFPNVNGNLHLSKVASSLRDRIFRYRFIAITIPGHIEEYIRAHDEILDAVTRKEAEQAGKLMREHVFYVKEVLVEFLKQSPGL